MDAWEAETPETTSRQKVETVDSVVSTKTVERQNAGGGQNQLADTADTADTQFVGRIDSAHVCQKRLADMAELADMAD